MTQQWSNYRWIRYETSRYLYYYYCCCCCCYCCFLRNIRRFCSVLLGARSWSCDQYVIVTASLTTELLTLVKVAVQQTAVFYEFVNRQAHKRVARRWHCEGMEHVDVCFLFFLLPIPHDLRMDHSGSCISYCDCWHYLANCASTVPSFCTAAKLHGRFIEGFCNAKGGLQTWKSIMELS